jgi:hypothetical protein
MTKQSSRGVSFKCDRMAMKNTHHAKMMELLIGRNLDWFES